MQIPIISAAIHTCAQYLTGESSPVAKLQETITTSTMGNLTRFTALLAAVLPASLVLADSPPDVPKIRTISYSGNGCIKDPKLAGGLNDPTFTFPNFAASYPGSNQTLNCEVHIQTSGGSAGWQFALKDSWVKGHVVLSPGACLDYYTQVFFSANAAKTVSFIPFVLVMLLGKELPRFCVMDQERY